MRSERGYVGMRMLVGAAAPVGPIGQAEDLQTQNLMNNAIRVAQIW